MWPVLVAALNNQRERVTWAVIALFLGGWLITHGMEIGELKSDLKHAYQAIEDMAEDCEGN